MSKRFFYQLPRMFQFSSKGKQSLPLMVHLPLTNMNMTGTHLLLCHWILTCRINFKSFYALRKKEVKFMFKCILTHTHRPLSTACIQNQIETILHILNKSYDWKSLHTLPQPPNTHIFLLSTHCEQSQWKDMLETSELDVHHAYQVSLQPVWKWANS